MAKNVGIMVPFVLSFNSMLLKNCSHKETEKDRITITISFQIEE